jgi:hypothetical protein
MPVLNNVVLLHPRTGVNISRLKNVLDMRQITLIPSGDTFSLKISVKSDIFLNSFVSEANVSSGFFDPFTVA